MKYSIVRAPGKGDKFLLCRAGIGDILTIVATFSSRDLSIRTRDLLNRHGDVPGAAGEGEV